MLVLAATGGLALWLDTSLHRTAVFADYAERPDAGRGTTWLLVGSDSRDALTPEQQAELATGGDVGSRTDTIMVVHIPRIGSSAPVAMISIPRDSLVEIPGYGSDKVNAAFSYGGPALLAQTVELATGLRFDHYAEVGFGGFATVVDAAGGVTVCPPEPIDDPLAGINLPAGCQRVDGRQALGYVRTRATPRADLDRMAHQRAFLSTLLHRVASPAVWLNPLRWYPLATSATDALTVDDDCHIWSLARLGWAIRGDMVTTTVPIGGSDEGAYGSAVVWDSDAAGRLFAAVAADAPLPADALDASTP